MSTAGEQYAAVWRAKVLRKLEDELLRESPPRATVLEAVRLLRAEAEAEIESAERRRNRPADTSEGGDGRGARATGAAA